MKINFNKEYKSQSSVIHPTELKREGSNEYLFNSKGDMNASDKKDVMSGQKQFLAALSSGQVNSKQMNYTVEAKEKIMEIGKELTAAIKTNNSDGAKKAVAAVSNMVYEYAQREGFMRKFLKQINVE